ncbi:FtsK/SpoIIIE domain-containing protein [Streptomyces sp. NPDC058297]|uniref:FtsK/SpoIIIE domain-containing protein n=1 Tax=Streptomyces sp. NPDC058297 TaxID=3346433 RepID=UPI0036EE8727
MGKKRNRHDDDQVEDIYGQSAGAIGGLVIVLGILYAIKDKTGLPWPAAMLLTVGVLVGLGYLAWRVKTEVVRRWARKPAEASSAAVAQESPAEGLNSEQAAVPAHPELTRALARTGAIGKDETIALHDVITDVLDVGTQYTFLLPAGTTHEDVASRLGQIASMFNVTRLHLKLETSRETERQVRLLVLKEPPFSRLFDPPNGDQIRAFDGVPLGHEVTGELGGVPTFNGASMLVAGMTQTGKTTLVNGLITCLLIAYGDDFDMVLLDGKFVGLADFKKIALRYESSSDPAVLESILDYLISVVDKRYAEMEQAKTDRKPAPVFRWLAFIIDEAADFYAHNGTKESKEVCARVEEKSRYVVAKGLECGVSVIMMTQRPDKDAIPVNVRAQFQYRICLYVDSEGAAKVALGDSYFTTMAPIKPQLLNPKIKGQAVLYAHGTSTLIRGFNFPEKFVWDVIDETHERRQRRYSATPDTPLKQAIKLMRDKDVDFMSTPDMATSLGVMESDPTERGKKLKALLGVPAGKGAKGVRGYHLSDLTAAAMSDS